MRQSGKESTAENFAFVARADYKTNVGFNVGASVFTGDANQGTDALSGVKTTISEIHAGYTLKGLKLRGLYAQSKVDNANKIAIATNSDASGKGSGYYLEGSYDVTNKWTPFVRYEQYNRFDEKFTATTGASTASDKDTKNRLVGVNFFPTQNVVVKADYNFRETQGVKDNRVEMALGYVF